MERSQITEDNLPLLDQLPRIEASPFFITRLEGRIARWNDERVSYFFIPTPLKVALFTMTIALTVSVYTAFFLSTKNNTQEQWVDVFIELHDGEAYNGDLLSYVE